MPANRFNGYTGYGIGIGLRVPHCDRILSRKPVVDWFEIISENYTVDVGRPLRILDQILDQYRVVQHGVSMYFGSAQRLKLNVEQQAAVLRESCAHASELGWFCLPESEEDSRLLIV
jgi:uncharacterized protein (UPF0276 family)